LAGENRHALELPALEAIGGFGMVTAKATSGTTFTREA
jgi:hypothetical protein